MTFVDRTGLKYGMLTALRVDDTIKKSRQGKYWICECECGNIVSVRGNILGKNTKSCGCIKKQQDKQNLGRYTTGKSHSRLAAIWYHMNGRCHNENDYNYSRYGEIGITVYDEWRNDFLKFEEWALSNGYADELSIDRIDVTGNYEPSNCRWANFEVQSNNKRGTLWVEYEGQTLSLKQAYRLAEPKITYTTAKARYHQGERNPLKLFESRR